MKEKPPCHVKDNRACTVGNGPYGMRHGPCAMGCGLWGMGHGPGPGAAGRGLRAVLPCFSQHILSTSTCYLSQSKHTSMRYTTQHTSMQYTTQHTSMRYTTQHTSMRYTTQHMKHTIGSYLIEARQHFLSTSTHPIEAIIAKHINTYCWKL